MAEQRYRFGGPIPESVRRMQARRFAAVARVRVKPFGVDALGMPIFVNPGVLTKAEIAAAENRTPLRSGTRR